MHVTFIIFFILFIFFCLILKFDKFEFIYFQIQADFAVINLKALECVSECL